MLNYTVNLNEDEIVLTIQSVQQLMIANQRKDHLDIPGPGDPLPPETVLLRKLLDIRTEGITAARAAGTLK